MEEVKYSAGMRLRIRDAEWFVRGVKPVRTGGQALYVRGITCPVQGRDQIFWTEAEKNTAGETEIEIIRPENVELRLDTSSHAITTRLRIESVARHNPVSSGNIAIAHHAAMDVLNYQLQPAYHALNSQRDPRSRILIADAVGLGKTLEAGVLLSELICRGAAKRILVVTLKSMMAQFQKEMWCRFSIPLVRLDSTGLQRIRSEIPSNHNPFNYYDKTIVSVDTLKQDNQFKSALESAHWDVIVIDEAHSSQNGEMASSLAASVSGNAQTLNEDGEPEDTEDKIHRIIKGRKLAKNANYYAFTATPKNKTLEMFGEEHATAEGLAYAPFHEYTMKQAIEEKFILDVVRNYTPYQSYYEVVKKVEDDPQFDKDKAPKRIRAYVERQPETIEAKSRIIVDHFCTKVFRKIGGRARAMVVTSSIERAIDFYQHISRLLEEQGGTFKAIVAFTDKEIDGHVVTESSLNGFPSSAIEDKIEEEPYRLLIVADKFQTGYDQPLLHTMYVDKVLSDLKAVQTLSRLNRAHPKKFDTFVLDFANDPEDIRAAFQRYYKTTILEGESDVNKLNDLIETVERQPFYTDEDKQQVVELRLSGNDEDRLKIDAILDAVVVRFKEELNEEEQVRAKSAMKNFCRIYPFFAAIMPFESADWEKQYLFYVLLVKKLPKLKREDFTAGLLETIDFDKYRIQKLEERDLTLENVNATVSPIPVGSGGGIPGVEFDSLSRIIEDFNATFGGIDWKDEDEVRRQIQELPKRMAQDDSFVHAVRNGDSQVAQIQFNDIIQNIVATMGEEKLEFMRQYFDNAEFRNFVNERVFRACLKDIGENVVRKAPTTGWAVRPDEEETDGGYLAAAESGDEDGE